jgi:hypothetical protein
MQHPLDGVRAKIERAMEHFDKLRRDASPFERNAYTVRGEKDFEKGAIVFFAQDMGLGEPPIQLSLLAGEIAYQLRSALDHLVYQLISANGQTPDRKGQFPIFKSPNEYESRAGPMIQGLSPRAGAVIESLQPYHRHIATGYDTLWMLNDLNNTDKHRLVPVCLMAGGEMRVVFPYGEYSELILTIFHLSPLKNGAKLYTWATANLQVDVQAELRCSIAFEQIGDSKLEAVIPFFTKAISEVSRIIDKFCKDFF